MSRRGSHYKGGVTRGREDQPRRGKLVTIKRGSPITFEKSGSKSNTVAEENQINNDSQTLV